MARQLNLNRDQLDQCYEISARIISHAAKYIDRHSSPSVEKATLMLLGVEGFYRGVPFASWMVDRLTKDQLRSGAAHWWGRALLSHPKEAPKQLAEKLARGKIKWIDLPEAVGGDIRRATEKIPREKFQDWSQAQKKRGPSFLNFRSFIPPFVLSFTEGKPRKMVSIAKEWSQKDVACLIAHWETHKNLQEETPLEEWQEACRGLKDFKVVPATSGLAALSQVILAIQEGVPVIGNDGWGAIFQEGIDPKRALIDHNFALQLGAKFSLKIWSGHSLWMPASLKMSQALVLLLLYEQLGHRRGLPLTDMVLSSRPTEEKSPSLIHLLAEGQVLREMFPQSLLSFRLSHHLEFLYCFAAVFTDQNMIELSLREKEKLDQMQGWLRQLEGANKEFSVEVHGKMARTSHVILEHTLGLLKKMEKMTLWKVFESDLFPLKFPSKNLGGEGVFQKSYHYWNPVEKWMQSGVS